MRPAKEPEAVRVQEFVAHSTAVNCASIGPKSCGVLATGGEDAKVNIWRVGSATNLWTLGYNKSPIECLCFDSDELCVVSGAMNGSLKVFDLNEGKLARNLGAHQTNVTTVQYHPYGEFIISGSADCTMKLWDVRNKACIETYTGHSKEVTCVRFSPDGKWVASASKDGLIHFWDLIASKHIDTIKVAPNYVTAFEFNPAELSMAAMTTSRTVKLWDLESMKALSYTPPESAMVKAMAFNNLGNQMFTTSKNVLKVWDLDPALRMAEQYDVGWSDRIVDMKVSNNDTIVAASYTSNFVSVWEVDLDALRAQPSAPVATPKDSGGARESGSGRESKAMATAAVRQDKDCKDLGDKDVQRGAVTAPSAAAPTAPGKGSVHVSQVSYKDLYEEYKEAPRARPAPAHAPAPAPLHEEEEEDEEEEDFNAPDDAPSPSKDMAASMGESFWKKFKDSLKDPGLGEEEVGVPNDELDDLLPPSAFADLAPGRRQPQPQPGAGPPARPAARPSPSPSSAVAAVRSGGGLGREDKAADGLAVVGMRHLRLDSVNNRFDEAPPSSAGAATVAQPRQPSADPSVRITAQCHELLDSLLASSARLPADLSNRLVSLRVLRQLWTKGQVLDCIDHLQGLSDAMKLNNPHQVHLLADFFAAIDLKACGISLDACVKMLPIFGDMLANSASWHSHSVILAVYRSLASLLEAFGELIRSTRAVLLAGGVDLSREARLAKCNACHAVFAQCRVRLDTLKHQFRADAALFDVLDQYQRLCAAYLS